MGKGAIFWSVMAVLLVLLLASPAGAVRTMIIFAGNGQSATVATVVPVQPAVRVLEDGAPVAGIRVLFSVTGGGGTIAGPVAITNTNGVASAGSWKLGTRTGTNTLS